MNVAIIGAGPIGCYAGYLLAKSGHRVNIYERKSQVGWPIQCTGLLTADFKQFHLSLNDSIVNVFKAINLHATKQQVNLLQPEDLVCRKRLDRSLAQLARAAGARINFRHNLIRKEGPELILAQSGKEVRIKPDLVLAADGPLSPTAKLYRFYHPDRRNCLGMQALVKGNFEHTDSYTVIFNQRLAPGKWAWIVPESRQLARVGLFSNRQPREHFESWIKQNGWRIQEWQTGLVPLYLPQQKLKKGNCYLLGDAAGFVKATTFGGIVPGMRQARILVKCLNQKRNYLKEIKPLQRELWLQLQARKMLDRFTDKDWNYLLRLIKQKRIQQVFGKYTRDNPIPLFISLIVKEPRLLYFIKHLI